MRRYSRPTPVALTAVVAIAVVAALFLSHRRGRLGWAAVVLLAISGVASSLVLAAIQTDYRDADGFVDCWPHCTAFQEAVQVTLFLTQSLFAIGVVAAVVAIDQRRRAKRAL